MRDRNPLHRRTAAVSTFPGCKVTVVPTRSSLGPKNRRGQRATRIEEPNLGESLGYQKGDSEGMMAWNIAGGSLVTKKNHISLESKHYGS